jgi:hypothetical protein
MIDISPAVIAKRINDTRKGVFLKEGQKRNLTSLYFEERNLLTPEIKDALETIKEVSKHRDNSAHKVLSPSHDKDYPSLQNDLTHRVQNGIRVLLDGFMQGEKANSSKISKTVLSYRIQ